MTLWVTETTTAAVRAPTRNLPSMAMLSMPLRSDRMPANAPSETGTAYSRLPVMTAVRLAALPSSRLAMIVRTQTGTTISSVRRHGNRAPRTSWPMATAPVMTPVRTHIRPTVVDKVSCSPPCSLIQNENVAVVPKEPIAE